VQGAENFETDLRLAYPPGARLRNEEGAVRALVELTSAGRAKEVTLEASSGFASLDKVALDAIRKAHFRAKSGAVKEGALMRLSIRFKLADEALRP
jgi:TonB family protein